MIRTLQKILLCGILPAIATSCGSPGVPLPPSLQLPAVVADLKAVRKGNHVSLTWSVPTRNSDQTKIRHWGRTQVCRSLMEPVNPKQCDLPAGTVAPPASPGGLASSSAQPSRLESGFVDDLQPSQLSENGAAGIFYAVSVLNERGRSAGLSNQVRVPAAPVLAPPDGLKVAASSAGIVLNWNPVPQPKPISDLTHIYRAYRREVGGANEGVAGELPVDAQEPRLLDHSFEWEKSYDYRVTVVTQIWKDGKLRDQVEGDDTPPIRVLAHDIFPPAVPSGLQAVYSSARQQFSIDLIWSPDSDPDLAGYNVYRREADKPGGWLKITPQLIATPAYRDSNVSPRSSYLYSVTAVDVRQNESAKSEAAAEETP